MRDIRWDHLKSSRLKRTRGITFEEILGTELIEIKRHPKRKDQDIMLFWHKNQIWVVPFVNDKRCIFLKTIFPSRKYTKLYKEASLNEKS